MDYGRHLISKVVADGSLKAVTDLGITLDHFVSTNDRSVYETIVDHHQRYGNVPKLATLKMDFPDYRFVKTEETVDFLADKVRAAYTGAMLEQLLSAAVEYYDEGEFDVAAQFIEDGIRSLKSSSGSKIRPLDVETMLAKWERYRENPPEGVPYGLKQLDEATRGMQEDDFVVLAGPPGSGKSALLLNMAITAVRARRKILFITIEMSDEHHMYRVAAHVTGIGYKKIKFGPLRDREAQAVDDAVRAIAKDGRFVLQEIEPAMASIAAVESLIEQHHPDVVYIDGAYLMQLPGVRAQAAQWERLSALTREMRALVLRKKVRIAISTQVLESKMQGGQVTSASVGYSSSFHQDASVMLGIQPDAELEDRQTVKALKVRDAPKMQMHLKWDWETYRYSTPDEEGAEF